MKSEPSPTATGDTPFERFVDFARRIIAVPKSEIKQKIRVNKRNKHTAPTQRES